MRNLSAGYLFGRAFMIKKKIEEVVCKLKKFKCLTIPSLLKLHQSVIFRTNRIKALLFQITNESLNVRPLRTSLYRSTTLLDTGPCFWSFRRIRHHYCIDFNTLLYLMIKVKVFCMCSILLMFISIPFYTMHT